MFDQIAPTNFKSLVFEGLKVSYAGTVSVYLLALCIHSVFTGTVYKNNVNKCLIKLHLQTLRVWFLKA